MRINWKKVAYLAAELAYQSEVIDTEMEELIIGERKDYESRTDWIEQRVQEWVEELLHAELKPTL